MMISGRFRTAHWGVVLLTVLLTTLLIADPVRAQETVVQNKTVKVAAIQRSYHVHIPPDWDRSQASPLVLVLHGGGGNGEKIREHTRFDELADREKFIVAYPEGINHHWNDGRNGNEWEEYNSDVDDVAFIAALIDDCVRDYAIDSRRVYVAGMSNGAMMCYRLACQLSDKITAIATVAGNMPENLAQKWPLHPVAVLMINGTEDPIVPFDGGDVCFFGQKRGTVMSVYNSIKFWVTNNYCSLNPDTTQILDQSRNDATRVLISHYQPADQESDVVLYKVEGGGHTWPGTHPYAREQLIGRTSQAFDATTVIWDFFKRHTRL